MVHFSRMVALEMNFNCRVESHMSGAKEQMIHHTFMTLLFVGWPRLKLISGAHAVPSVQSISEQQQYIHTELYDISYGAFLVI